MTAHVATDWDPFEGGVPAQCDKIAKPGLRVAVPAWVTTSGFLGAVLGFLILLSSQWLGGQPAMITGIVLIAVSFATVFLASTLRKDEAYQDWMFLRVAQQNGWSFRLVNPPKVADRERNEADVTRAKAIGQTRNIAKNLDLDGDTVDKMARFANSIGAKEKVYDPQVAKAYDRIGRLMAPRLGQPMPVDIRALYRGRTRSGTAFWLGAQAVAASFIAASKDLKTDARGNTANHGHSLGFVMAFPLDRDTGIQVDLLADAVMDSRTDFDTESMQFNRAFDVRLRNAGTGVAASEINLLRVLSPATQTAMLDLKVRYRAQFIIENDVVFVSGYDLVNIEDPVLLSGILAGVVDDFATAATSFKHYAQ